MSRRPAVQAACLLSAALILGLAACRREAAPRAAGSAAPSATTRAATFPPTPPLQDVAEHDPRYVIGISYPAVANRYPGLAAELKRYADAARAELMQAVAGLGGKKPAAPYDLTLSFVEVASTPRVVAIDADGSTYTGGAHGNPLVACFVWLPQRNELLTATRLVPDRAAWATLAAYIRDQLHTALSQRVDADGLSGEQRTDVLKDGGRMIDQGTGPDPQNFSQFEPLLAPDGRITALRFVFPPYQVGPYADGRQTVDVPDDVLLPHVAPAYRDLFAGG
ncbi:MAG: DUF3298 domain-containing protein [Lysobacter sp.]|nr:DUF3298 domain-containing protein [Lysobacter sp.]